MASELKIASRIMHDIQLCPGCENQSKDEITAELMERANHIIEVYSRGGGSIMIWDNMDRFALFVVKSNKALEEDLIERALDDLTLCENGFDVLPLKQQNALSAIHAHLYAVMVSTSRSAFTEGVAKITDERNDPEYVLEVLHKFARPSTLDEKAFGDRVVKRIWVRFSGQNEEFIAKRMKRIPKIEDALRR